MITGSSNIVVYSCWTVSTHRLNSSSPPSPCIIMLKSPLNFMFTFVLWGERRMNTWSFKLQYLFTQWTYTVVRGSVMGQDFRLQVSSPNRHELWQVQARSKKASFVVWKGQEFAYHRLQSSSYTPLSAISVSPSVQGAVHSVWGREQTREWCMHQLTFW